MGILTRFKDIMSSNINALLDKAEDPEKMIDQCLRNLNADLGKVKSETASVMAEEARAKRELNDCTEQIEEMQTYAVKAVQAGNDNDAKTFLERKAALTRKQADLQQAYDLAAANSAHMQEMHDKLTGDIQELEARRSAIKGKLAAAKAQEHINEMNSSIKSSNRSIDAFERMEAKADAALDSANAMAALNAREKANDLDDLKAKYSSPASDIDQELMALKESLNKE